MESDFQASKVHYAEGNFSRLSASVPGGILRRYTKDLNAIQRFSDAILAGFSLWSTSFILQNSWGEIEQIIAIFSIMFVLVFARRIGVYTSFRNDSHWSLLRRLLLLWSSLIGTVTLTLFIFQAGHRVSREQFFVWFLIYGTYLILSHLLSRQILRVLRLHGRNSRCDGFIGTYEGLERVQSQFQNASWLGHRIRAELCWHADLPPSIIEIQHLRNRFEHQLPDQWLIEETADSQLLSQLLNCLQDQSSPVLLIPRWLKQSFYKPRFCQLGGINAIELWGHSDHATPLQLNTKHFFDIIFAASILVVISPFIAMIILAIKLDSKGPILFIQRRYGLNGKPFNCLKFRTMTAQQDFLNTEQAKRNDPRVTKVGAFLRSSNLDELPQLINVLRGEMSLVGPRPHAAIHNEYYRTQVEAYMRRHSLRPGLTGWAQIQGLRGETDTIDKMAARVKADIDYIQEWSLMLDIKIFILTFFNWSGKNAY